MVSLLHRLLSVGILLVWTAPGLAASSTALHLALDHHDAPDAEHTEEIAHLVLAATHGHHHDLTTPAHEHEVSRTAPSPLPKPVVFQAFGDPRPSDRTDPDERAHLDIPARPGPPEALFTSHCSLLL